MCTIGGNAMKTINHILFPTDFSPNAENALPFALELACQFGADITLFHAIEEPYDFSSVVEEYKGKLTKTVENLLQDKVEELKKDSKYGHITIHYAIRIGKVVRAILEETERDEIDFIVMGTQGSANLAKRLFGSHTSDVILYSEVPVFTVPKDAKFEGLEHITFSTDYHEKDVDALDFVAILAEKFYSAISVVHVDEEENFESLIKFKGFRQQVLEETPLHHMNYEMVIGEDFFDGIRDFITIRRSSLLTMTRNDKNIFRKLFESSYSKKLSFYNQIPLLIMV